MSLEDRIKKFEKCLKKFEEVLNLEKTEVVRDSAIKRKVIKCKTGKKN